MRGRATEHQEQAALMRWAKMRAATLPELELLFAIPNGGLRDILVARKLQAEGVKAGVPDLCLPVARQGYHGLFLEMKVGRRLLTAAQKEWGIRLEIEGYKVTAAWGWDDAREQLEFYLTG